MDKPIPRIYYLYGDDEFAMAEFAESLKDRLGDETAAEMNYQFFDAHDLDWASFEAAASSMPFLSDRRLVVLDRINNFRRDTEIQKRLISLFESIPQSTALLVKEYLDPVSKKRPASPSKMLQWAQEHPDLCLVRSCTTPQGNAFVTWLQQQASALGGSIEHDAAQLLSEWTDEDPRLASLELVKLLDYVDYQHPIHLEDVEQCTPYRGQADIFALVDAIGLRQGEEASRRLHALLQNYDSSYAFGMIIRQFRLILKARDMMDASKTPDHNVDKTAFVVRKASAQARNFSLQDLERIYHELLMIDLSDKNSQMELDVALDRLIAAIAS